MKFYNSTHNFYIGEKCKVLDDNNYGNEISSFEVIKNEEFGFFMTIDLDEESCINILGDMNLPWWGLSNIYRVELECEIDSIKPHLVGYVKDDDRLEKADIILNDKSKNYKKGEAPIYISGKIPKDFDKDSLDIQIKIYKIEGYEKEFLVESEKFSIGVIDFVLEEDFDGDFYMDLWQHPCSWARVNGVDYFSDKHFEIIEKYLIEMKKLGQKVIGLVISDFPWAGQKCFDVKTNPSRLYEYNIIKVSKKGGKLNLDFSNLDRYVELCFRLGIKEEINLFGIIGNWHGYDFGSPLSDYRDPIRVRVFNEDEGIYDFIRTKEELKEYLSLVFEHLHVKGYLKITKIIGDEPEGIEIFNEYSGFLKTCTDHELKFKYALLSPNFLREYEGDFESFSVISRIIGDYCENGELTGKLSENANKMTWYSCCMPESFNVFIKSPLIEGRYYGIYTYYWGLKGMLRWAYGIYVEDVYKDITYKPEKWSAGDMLFAYPGKNGQIEHSIREKNMLFGVQDFNIAKMLQRSDSNVYRTFREKMGIEILAHHEDGDIVLDPYISYNTYLKNRNDIIKSYLENNNV